MRRPLVLVVLAALARVIHACECVPPPPPKEELQGADAVFVGRVIGTRLTRIDLWGMKNVPGVVVQFVVARSWKGPQEHTITIVTGRGHGDCGFPFKTGDDYLVYASRDKSGDRTELRTNICTRTRLLADAGSDLAQLGAPMIAFGDDSKRPTSVELGNESAVESKSHLVFIIVTAGGIGLVLGIALGLAFGIRWARRAPLLEGRQSSTDITASPSHRSDREN